MAPIKKAPFLKFEIHDFFRKPQKKAIFALKYGAFFYLWFPGVTAMIFLVNYSIWIQNKIIVAPNGAQMKKCATEYASFFEKSWFFK